MEQILQEISIGARNAERVSRVELLEYVT